MAFISEEIKREEDKEYFNSFKFTDVLGNLAEPYWWAIDRERNIILYPRGGGSFEIPVGYGLSIDGKLIEIEVEKKTKGDIFDYNLEIYWMIKKVVVPNEVIQKGYAINIIKQLIEDAFIGLGTTGVNRKDLVGVTVDIEAEINVV